MPNPIATYMGPHAQALPLRDERLKLIASNLANADTPGYKAKDLDFEGALDALTGKAPLRATDARHFDFPAPPGHPPFQFARPQLQPSLDGNTVDAHAERAAYGRAALEYRASLTFIETKVRTMLTAITGQ